MRLSLRLVIEEYATDSVDDPRTIAVALAADDCTTREQVLIYQDMLRLTGQRPEIAGVTPFDPTPFIVAARNAGVSIDVAETNEGPLAVVPNLQGPFSGFNGLSSRADALNALSPAWDALTQGELQVLRNTLKRRRGLQ